MENIIKNNKLLIKQIESMKELLNKVIPKLEQKLLYGTAEQCKNMVKQSEIIIEMTTKS